MLSLDRSSLIQASLPFGRSGVGTPNQAPLTLSIQYTRADPNSVWSPTWSKTRPAGEAWRASRRPALTVAMGNAGPPTPSGGGSRRTLDTGRSTGCAWWESLATGARLASVVSSVGAVTVGRDTTTGAGGLLVPPWSNRYAVAPATATAAITASSFMSDVNGIPIAGVTEREGFEPSRELLAPY